MLYMHKATGVHWRDQHGKPWVASITGADRRFGLRRTFHQPRLDYRNADKRMSGKMAGIEYYFLLEEGWVCEFYVPGEGRKKPDRRFFAEVLADGLREMEEHEVLEWLTSKR